MPSGLCGCRYAAASRWRPVPLFVGGKLVVDDAHDGGVPATTLELAVETNAQLKASLQNVNMKTLVPARLAVEPGTASPEGSFDEGSRELKWAVTKELHR